MAKRKRDTQPSRWRNRIIRTAEMAPDQLQANPKNWRVHPYAQQDALAGVLDEVGWVQQVIVRDGTDTVVDGHLRVMLALREGEPTIPVVYVDLNDDEEALILATLDPLAAMAGTDREQLDQLLEDLRSDDESLQALLDDLSMREGTLTFADEGLEAGEGYEGPSEGGPGATGTDDAAEPAGIGSLALRFGVPPFTVLDTRQGYWQARKRSWIALGIKSELGRGGSDENGLLGISENARSKYANQTRGPEQVHPVRVGDGGLANQLANGTPFKPTFSSDEYLSHARRDAGMRGRVFGQEINTHPDAKPKAGKAIPGGETGKNSAWMFRDEHGRMASLKQRGAGQYVDGVLMKSDSGNDPAYYFKKQAVEKQLGRELTTAEFQEHYYEGPGSYLSGTSIFDPVLCEMVYRWFSPPEAQVLDPFAGGSVRGIVAGMLGRHYTGIDLSERQIIANQQQMAAIWNTGSDLVQTTTDEGDDDEGTAPEPHDDDETPGNQEHATAPVLEGDDEGMPEPVWLVGDALKIDELVPKRAKYDLLFSCPPYADLEVYSDDPRDLSTMDYADFLSTYRQIIATALARLRDDRFAAFVVGDVRDSSGFYRGFIADTIRAFEDAGARLYNEAIIVNPVGSLAIRVGKQFTSSRKLGKTHQNVLVFVKGDATRAVKACGEVEVALPATMMMNGEVINVDDEDGDGPDE